MVELGEHRARINVHIELDALDEDDAKFILNRYFDHLNNMTGAKVLYADGGMIRH